MMSQSRQPPRVPKPPVTPRVPKPPVIPREPWARDIFYSPWALAAAALAGLSAVLIDPYRAWMAVPFGVVAYVGVVLLHSALREKKVATSAIYQRGTSGSYSAERNQFQREVNLLNEQLETTYSLKSKPLKSARAVLEAVADAVDQWDGLARNIADATTLEQIVRSYLPATTSAFVEADSASTGKSAKSPHRVEFYAQLDILREQASEIAARAGRSQF